MTLEHEFGSRHFCCCHCGDEIRNVTATTAVKNGDHGNNGMAATVTTKANNKDILVDRMSFEFINCLNQCVVLHPMGKCKDKDKDSKEERVHYFCKNATAFPTMRKRKKRHHEPDEEQHEHEPPIDNNDTCNHCCKLAIQKA